jgi:hypothetical protein
MNYTRGQIAALIIGSMMFLPGLCFFTFGIGGLAGDGGILLFIGVAILGVVAWLDYIAFHQPPPPPN